MLKYRIVTAIILIPLVLLAIFYLPPVGFAIISALVILLAIWEWTNLIKLSLNKRIAYLLVLVCCLFISLLMPVFVILVFTAIFWLLIWYFIWRYEQFKIIWTKHAWLRVIAGFWISVPCWLALNVIRVNTQGSVYLLLLLVLVWSADTGAYFVGRRWGKRKLVPTISPGKTVAGFVGGTVCTLLVAILSTWFLKLSELHAVELCILAIIIALVSVLGDLFESMVKRQSEVKDSGHWLPGHGGILDRIDSLTAAAPFFALGLIILGI